MLRCVTLMSLISVTAAHSLQVPWESTYLFTGVLHHSVHVIGIKFANP